MNKRHRNHKKDPANKECNIWKNTLEGINNVLDEAENQEQFGRQGRKNTQSEQQKEKWIKKKWD